MIFLGENEHCEWLLRNLASTLITSRNGTEEEVYYRVENSAMLEFEIGQFFDHLLPQSTTFSVSPPYMDVSGIGMVIGVCKPAYSKEQALIGIACIDIPYRRVTSIIDIPGDSK